MRVCLFSDTWQCLLCTDLSDVLDGLSGTPPAQPSSELSPAHLKVARRLLLELYCQYEPSLPFREIVGPEVRFLPRKVASSKLHPIGTIFIHFVGA